MSSDGSEDEGSSSADEAVYCICRGPDDGSFMISCDHCNGWYHAKCVDLSKAEAKALKTYTCPNCDKDESAPDTREPSARKGSTKSRAAAEPSPASEPAPKPPTKSPARRASSTAAETPEKERKRAAPPKAETAGSVAAPATVVPVGNVCATPGCGKPTPPGIDRCEDCVMALATQALLGGGMLAAAHDAAPPPENGGPSRDASEEKHERRASVDAGVMGSSVRSTVYRNLLDALNARLQHDDEAQGHEDVESVVAEIERCVFEACGRTSGDRYKAKFRSILFNVKDHRNPLYRAIVSGEISAERLAHMSSEEMAPVELAKWREREKQRSAEVVEDAPAKILLKTHKGDMVVDAGNSVQYEAIAESHVIDPVVPASDEARPFSSIAVPSADAGASVPHTASHGHVSPGTVPMAPRDGPPLERRESLESSARDRDVLSLSDGASAMAAAAMQPVSHERSEKAAKSLNSVTSRRVSQTRPRSGSDRARLASPTAAAEGAEGGMEGALPDILTRVWRGAVVMTNLAEFTVSAHPVVGSGEGLSELLPAKITVNGRITHTAIEEYLGRLAYSQSKELFVARLDPESDADATHCAAMHSYFDTRGRCAVVGPFLPRLVDCYLVPVSAHGPLPRYIRGAGSPDSCLGKLLLVIVRLRADRKASIMASHPHPEGDERAAKRQAQDSPQATPQLTGASPFEHSPAIGASPAVRASPQIAAPTAPAPDASALYSAVQAAQSTDAAAAYSAALAFQRILQSHQGMAAGQLQFAQAPAPQPHAAPFPPPQGTPFSQPQGAPYGHVQPPFGVPYSAQPLNAPPQGHGQPPPPHYAGYPPAGAPGGMWGPPGAPPPHGYGQGGFPPRR